MVSRSHRGYRIWCCSHCFVAIAYEAIHGSDRRGLWETRDHGRYIYTYSTPASDSSLFSISFKVTALLSRPPTPVYTVFSHYSRSMLTAWEFT